MAKTLEQIIIERFPGNSPTHRLLLCCEWLTERIRLKDEALKEIESGAVYIDGKKGRTPKTRAREALKI